MKLGWGYAWLDSTHDGLLKATRLFRLYRKAGFRWPVLKKLLTKKGWFFGRLKLAATLSKSHYGTYLGR